MKIAIAEDNGTTRRELSRLLASHGYETILSDNFEDLADQLTELSADLILLDVNLPYENGYDICQKVRTKTQTPVIFVTSRDTSADELMSIRAGGIDFISKPYHPQVLLARIRKLLERTYEAQPSAALVHKGLTLYPLRGVIRHDGQEAVLSKNELGILRMLMVNRGNIIPRDALIDELWQSEQFIDENTLNVNIARLRKKLAEIGLPDYLETRRGLGYCV